MNPLNHDTLAELTIDALARTAFVVAEPIEASDLDSFGQPDAFARIRYEGPSAGWVYLSAATGFLCELAASLLGVESEDIDPQVEGRDALQELANIIGGSVILSLGGDERRLSLGLPEVTAGAPHVGPGGVVCHLDAEGERLDVVWQPDPAASAAA